MRNFRTSLSWMLVSLVVVASEAAIPSGIAASQTSESFLCVTGYTPQNSKANLETAMKMLELSCAANIFNDEDAAQELEELRERIPDASLPLKVEPNEAINSYLLIIHGKDVDRFPFFLLVDGVQTPFQFDDQRKHVHQVSVPREADLESPLTAHAYRYMMPGLSPGLHNVFPIIDGTVSQVSRSVVQAGGGSIMVGNGEPPEISSRRPPDSAFMSGSFVSDGESILPHEGLFLSHERNPASEDDVEPWTVKLRPGERFNYFIQARPHCSERHPNRDYWVSLFLNSRQIPIQAELPSRKGAYLRLACNEEVTIPASLRAPQEPGQYRLYPLGIANPYHAITSSTSVGLQPRVFPFFPNIYTVQVTDPN